MDRKVLGRLVPNIGLHHRRHLQLRAEVASCVVVRSQSSWQRANCGRVFAALSFLALCEYVQKARQ
eukprot:4019371-Amphidinium_carterae.2